MERLPSLLLVKFLELLKDMHTVSRRRSAGPIKLYYQSTYLISVLNFIFQPRAPILYPTYLMPVCIIPQLTTSGLSPATIKVYLSAFRHCQISMGMPSRDHTCMPKLQAVQVGVAKAYAFGKGVRPEWLPIDQVILRAKNGLELNGNRARYHNELAI